MPYGKQFVLFTVLLVLLSLGVTSMGQEATAKVRIGYFAFGPETVTTYIDGEPAPFEATWTHSPWNLTFYAAFPQFRTNAATPFMAFPAGTHDFAFAPRGEALDAAMLGPIEVTFEPDHVYSLAIVGHREDATLNMLVIRETELFAEIDPTKESLSTYIHNLRDVPALTITGNNLVLAENLQYGEFVAVTLPVGIIPMQIYLTDSPEDVLFAGGGLSIAGNSVLNGLIGTYPGEAGEDYFDLFAGGNPADATVIDAGVATIDTHVEGEISTVGQRVRYTVHVDIDTALNIYARATGSRYSGSYEYGMFDPYLRVYDATGNLLFWNNDIFNRDIDQGMQPFDAGLEGIQLASGTYIIEICGGGLDNMAGPFDLIIERVASN